MSRLVLAGLIPVLLMVGACQSEQGPPSAPPVSQAQFEAIRAEYQKADRDARVGRVKAVLASANLASVGDVPVKDFFVGDVISFLDSRQNLLTMGTVEAIGNSTLDVRYKTPGPTGRVPRPGDLAIRAIP